MDKSTNMNVIVYSALKNKKYEPVRKGRPRGIKIISRNIKTSPWVIVGVIKK